MKLGYWFGVAMLAAGIAAAQDKETQKKSETKISVEDGKSITVTGCVQRAPEGGYLLTNVAGKEGALASYVLTDDDDDLTKYVGHRVEISGKAADKGKGKLKIETKTETKGDGVDKGKTKAKSEVKGDLKGLPYLGVKSVRTIATVCP